MAWAPKATLQVPSWPVAEERSWEVEDRNVVFNAVDVEARSERRLVRCLRVEMCSRRE